MTVKQLIINDMNGLMAFFIQKNRGTWPLGKRVFECIAASLLLLIPVQVFAQKDAKAKEWLDKSASAFNKAGALTIHFTLNVRDVSNQSAESFEGQMEVKGAKFHVSTPDVEIWFDGKTQWFLQKAFDEVQITEPSPQEAQAFNPATVFRIYQKDCNYKYLGEKTDAKGRKVQEITLTPTAKDSEMTRITLHISAPDAMLTQIHIVYKNKIENVIHIHKYKPNPALTDSSFVFDSKKYPYAELLDLR